MKNKKLTVLILLLLSAGVVGIYYAQPFLAAPKGLQFQFQTREGDQEELEGLHLIATTWNDVENNLDISLEKTITEGSPFFGSIYTSQSKQLESWQKQYRSFMRNKQNYEGNYTEDESGLFYIEDNYGYKDNWQRDGEGNYLLAIERLDKETQEVTKKNLKISSSEELHYVSVQSFEKAGSFLAIRLIIGNYQGQEQITYFYNWDTEEITGELKQKEADGSNHQDSSGSSFSLEVLDDKEPRFLLRETRYYYDSSESIYEEVTKAEERNQLYNPATKELQDIQLPKEMSDESAQYRVGDGKVTLVTRQEGAIRVLVFDVENNKLLQEKEIAVAADTFGEQLYVQLFVQDGKLFVVENMTDSVEDTIGILILDTNHLDKRFEGVLQVSDDSKSNRADASIYIDDFYFE